MHGMPHHRHVGEREPGSVPFFDGQRFGLVVVPTVDRPLVAHHVPPEVCHEIDTGAIASRQNDTFGRLEEHTSELQSLMRISYAVFCLKKKKNTLYTMFRT